MRHRLALVVLLVLTGCGQGRLVDRTRPEQAAAGSLGWTRTSPIAVAVPRDRPVIKGPARTVDEHRPVLVNVWASYCGPCEAELPLLERLSSSSALQVLGLTRDVHRDSAARALRRAHVGYENWMDSEARFAIALDGRIPLSAVPASALLVDGRVVAVHVGAFRNRAEVLAGLRLAGIASRSR